MKQKTAVLGVLALSALGLGTASAQSSQGGFFSSLTQALHQGSDPMVVRGYVDVGSQRYYCVKDAKTGANQLNAVEGQLSPADNGITQIRVTSMSIVDCDKMERQGRLVTAGYTSEAPASAGATPVSDQASPPTDGAIGPAVDVGGLKLGASVDEAREFLKSKHLAMYKEWTQTLAYNDQAHGRGQVPVPNGTFVQAIAAWTWTPTSPMTYEQLTDAGESYVIGFTPVPGNGRVASILHTLGYTTATAITLSAFEDAFAKKYGEFDRSAIGGSGPSPTWIFQPNGAEEFSDGRAPGACALQPFAGTLNVAPNSNPPIAVSNGSGYTPYCKAAAMVTAQVSIPNKTAAPADRILTRYTVLAVSPTVAREGLATAARLTQDAVNGSTKAAVDHANSRPAPTL